MIFKFGVRGGGLPVVLTNIVCFEEVSQLRQLKKLMFKY